MGAAPAAGLEMPLDPQARDHLDALAKAGFTNFYSYGVEGARRAIFERRTLFPAEPVQLPRIENQVISGGIPVRIYWPERTPRGTLVYFHGGGWVIGNIDSHDGVCRNLTKGAGCLTVSVDYRLAPEHRFPSAVEDCYAATMWASENAASLGATGGRLAVGGDSAGGNLAAAVSLMARDKGGPSIAFQLLIYPVIEANFETPSYHENAEGYLLGRQDMIWYWDHYAPDAASRENPYAAPVKAKDLGGLPPALIQTAEMDPLRDEAEAYARRLEEAGVKVELTRYPGMIHGFFGLPHVMTKAKEAVDQASQALREALSS